MSEDYNDEGGIEYLYHVCRPVRVIIHSLKLVDYLFVQADKPWYINKFVQEQRPETDKFVHSFSQCILACKLILHEQRTEKAMKKTVQMAGYGPYFMVTVIHKVPFPLERIGACETNGYSVFRPLQNSLYLF